MKNSSSKINSRECHLLHVYRQTGMLVPDEELHPHFYQRVNHSLLFDEECSEKKI